MAKSKYLTWAFFWMVMIQYVGFKISWLLAAWGAIDGPPWSYYGALPFFVFLIAHVIYSKRVWELWFALSIGFVGTVLDTIYNITGLIEFNGSYPFAPWLSPIWMTSIWIGLAVTLDHSLKVLIGRPFWIFAVGAVFGPIAYWTGAEMGAIHFSLGNWTTMGILTIPWGLMLIFCYWLMEWWRPKEEEAEFSEEERLENETEPVME